MTAQEKAVYAKQYYAANRDRLLTNAKVYQKNNPEVARKASGRWYKKNKTKVRRYVRTRAKTDPYFRLKRNLRSRMNAALRGKAGSASTENLLGAPFYKVREHIASLFKEGMTWENYAHNTWHVDHKLPVVSFDLNDLSQQKKCFHYTNLQPLWAMDNLMKGAKKPFILNLMEA
jgi:hypothetical protein